MPVPDNENSSTGAAPSDDDHAMLTSELELDANAFDQGDDGHYGGNRVDDEDLTSGVWKDDPFAARAATLDESEGTFPLGSNGDDEQRSDSSSLRCAVSSDEDNEAVSEDENQPLHGLRAGRNGRRTASEGTGKHVQHSEQDEDEGEGEGSNDESLEGDSAPIPEYTGPTLAMLQAAVTYSADDLKELPEPSEASPGAYAEYEAVDDANGSGSLKVGKEYYLIDVSWWRSWRTYVHAADDEAVPFPGPIDNTPLLVAKPRKSPEKYNRRGVRRNSLSNRNPLSVAEEDNDLVNNNDDAESDAIDESEEWELRQGLQEVLDFETVSPEAWQLLVKWHGSGPPIKRRAYSEFSGGVGAKIDLYGVPLVARRSSDDSAQLPLAVLQAATVGQLTGALAHHWGLHPSRCRLWDYFKGTQYALLDKQRQQQLFDCNLTEGQEVMLEEQDQEGHWLWSDSPSPSISFGSFATSPTYSNAYSLGNYMSSSSTLMAQNTNAIMSTVAPEAPGLVGLDNLGNTCFMNSVLQSLGACPLLRDPFRLGHYKSDLNLDNPLGYGGKVADGFAELMQVLYQSDGNRVAPRAFKHVIGQLQPQFQGYAQHDAQELLNFLLDGLHEDVNRVLHKEMTAPVEANGRPDSEVASESVATFKKRNDSLLTDLCSGLFRSTLVCPDCGFVSKTFDPFFSVSVPLAKAPSEAEKGGDATIALRVLVCQAQGVPEPHTFHISRSAYMVALRAAVAACLGKRVSADCLVVVELYNHAVYKVFGDLDTMDDVTPSDELAVYEVEDVTAFRRHHNGSNDVHYLAHSPWPPLPSPSSWPSPTSSFLQPSQPLMPGVNASSSADTDSSPSSWSSRFFSPSSAASALFDAAVATDIVGSGSSAGPGWVADFGDDSVEGEVGTGANGSSNSDAQIRIADVTTSNKSNHEHNENDHNADNNEHEHEGDDAALQATSVAAPILPPEPPPPLATPPSIPLPAFPPVHPRSPWVPGAVYFGTLKPPWSGSGDFPDGNDDDDGDDEGHEGYGARLSAFVWSSRSRVGSGNSSRSRWTRKASAIKPRPCRLDVLLPHAVHELASDEAAAFSSAIDNAKVGVSDASCASPPEDIRSSEVGRSDSASINSASNSMWPPLREGCDARGVLSWQSAPGASDNQVVEGAYLVDLSFDPFKGTATVTATQPNRWLVGGPTQKYRQGSNSVGHTVGNMTRTMEPIELRGTVEPESEPSAPTTVPTAPASGLPDVSDDDRGKVVGSKDGSTVRCSCASATESGQEKGEGCNGSLWWGSIVPSTSSSRGGNRGNRNDYGDDDDDNDVNGLLILEWQSAHAVAASEVNANVMGLSYRLSHSAENTNHDSDISADVFDAFGSSSSSSSSGQDGGNNRSVVINVVHKRRKANEWSGSSYSERIGIPLLLTVRLDATEQQVRESIVAKAQSSGAAVQSSLSFQVFYANEQYDEDPKYNRKGKEGQEVGVDNNHSSNSSGTSDSSTGEKESGLVDADYVDSSEESTEQSHSSFEQSVRPTKRERSSPPRIWVPKDDSEAAPWYSRSLLPGATSFTPEDDDTNNRVPVVMFWGEAEKVDIFPSAAGAFSENQPSSTEASRSSGNGTASSGLTLAQCFSLFAATETLPAVDSWRCPKCQDFKEATKAMDLWSTPPLLCVHLKRFSVDAESFWVDKLETPVSFPTEQFDLRPFCVNPDNHQGMYTLCAVVNHFGGAGGGHYTAHARCESNGKWHEFDDSHVTEVTAQDLDPSAAYVLFYLREDLVPASWSQ